MRVENTGKKTVGGTVFGVNLTCELKEEI